MKKYLIVLAALAMVFVGCKKEGGSKYTSIRFKSTEITLAEGATSKLQVLYEPATIKKAPVCVWASSNPDKVSVDQTGKIEALEIGESNITATYGEGEDQLQAVCHVIVKDPLDMFAIGGMGVFKLLTEEDPLSEPYKKWDDEDQDSLTVVNYPGLVYVWSTDITYTRGSGFSGAGYQASFYVPVAVIQEGDYAGYCYNPLVRFTDTLATTLEGVCPEGALTDADEWHEYLYNDSTYDGDGSFKGAPIHWWDWDDDSGNSDVYFIGLIKNGILQGNTSLAYYKVNISWFDQPSIYGLKVAQDGEGNWDFVTPYEFATRTDKYYEALPDAGAATSRKIQPLKINEQQQIRMMKNLSSNKVFRNAK